MSHLLDTNACIALINGKPASVRIRFQKAITGGVKIFVPSIVCFELWYGVAKSSRQSANTKRLQVFLSGPVSVLPFEDEDAQIAGGLRATLEMTGKPIGAYDLLIAGQALRHKLTLVTANVSEFARVKELAWQDWGKS
ncbi:MAG: type II toxin-antitoxin system VapC family toxin [Terriglobia bacterium]